ncbi:uncharacterized protein B0H18DRAFT_864783, partial [Fomitopsis serialis]|uniref:uncharacterized protein n=1 Tax=Fomitopsis serialis TaxID=139415 RepID=UPI002007D9DD
HNLPLNPTPETLARYIAYTSQFIASGPKYLSGARHFLRDIFTHFDIHRSHPSVQATITGARKLRGEAVRRKLPLRTSHLAAFVHIAVLSKSYDDLLFATILSCMFYACHRSGELVVKTSGGNLDWRKIIKRSSLEFSGSRASYHLPYHKGDRFYTGTTILHMRHDVSCPVDLLRDYVRERDRRHGAKAALFLREDGSLPMRSWFEQRFFTVLDHTYGGHSARAGGATYYAGLGLSESVIQALGRWSS